jgi:hypothetical protein
MFRSACCLPSDGTDLKEDKRKESKFKENITGHVVCVQQAKNASKILIRKPEERILPGGHGRRWRMILTRNLNPGCDNVEFIHWAQNKTQWRTAVDKK